MNKEALKRIILKIYLFVLIFMLIAPNVSFSGSPELLSQFMLQKLNLKEKKVRLSVARELMNVFSQLDAYIPDLTPEESEWLDSENKALAEIKLEDLEDAEGLAFRIAKLFASPISRQKQLKDLMGEVKVNLKCIIDANDIKQEMLYWAKTSFLITNETFINEAITILENSKKIKIPESARSKLFLLEKPGRVYWSFGCRIHEYILIPYLAGSIVK